MKKKVYITTAAFAMLIIITIFIAANTSFNSSETAAEYVASLGWEVDKNPIEVEEVDLPVAFDDVYTNYNKLQNEAGFDLLDYAGKKATRYTFLITNFLDKKGIRANVLMYNGKIIGGDIMTVAIDGFMLPLKNRADTMRDIGY
ncbi:MAG: DUF4830 domain-containing protein [Clostridiaceae bacterium]|jgi:hypothetical protein|nr:DUF4830 domain-containing protein [Clostridiaceae bacterium]